MGKVLLDKMQLPFLTDIVADMMRKGSGWVLDSTIPVLAASTNCVLMETYDVVETQKRTGNGGVPKRSS